MNPKVYYEKVIFFIIVSLNGFINGFKVTKIFFFVWTSKLQLSLPSSMALIVGSSEES